MHACLCVLNTYQVISNLRAVWDVTSRESQPALLGNIKKNKKDTGALKFEKICSFLEMKPSDLPLVYFEGTFPGIRLTKYLTCMVQNKARLSK